MTGFGQRSTATTMTFLLFGIFLCIGTANGQQGLIESGISLAQQLLEAAADQQNQQPDDEPAGPLARKTQEEVQEVDFGELSRLMKEGLEGDGESAVASSSMDISPSFFDDIDAEEFIEQCILSNLYIDGYPRASQPRTSYEEKFFQAEDIAEVLRFDKKPPKTLEGIFWFNYDDFFAEAGSLAFTPERGGLNPGWLLPRPYPLRIRVNGDRNWAQIGFDPIIQFLVNLFDVKFNFQLLEGNRKFPIKFRIIFDLVIPTTCIRFELKNCLEQLLNLEMELQNTPHPSDPFPAHPQYPNSVVWERATTLVGQVSTYEVIQIVNGHGEKLQPAFDDFVTAMTTGARAGLGGTFVYNELVEPRTPSDCVGKLCLGWKPCFLDEIEEYFLL